MKPPRLKKLRENGKETVLMMVGLQLGREPAIGFTVEVKCPSGWPAVIRNDPFTLAGAPNPNIYYLTCPHLVREISRLEDASLIAKLEKRLKAEPELLEQLRFAQKEHRLEWLQAAERPAEEIPSPEASYPPPRIAGAKKPEALKCLHAHVAWGLTHPGYEIAEAVLEKIEARWCADDLCLRRLRRDGGS